MKPKVFSFIQELEEKKSKLAAVITELHFIHHPDLEERYGDKFRQNYREDTLTHFDYLIESVKLNSPELFNDYLEWAWHMLEARNTQGYDLISSIGLMQSAISEHIEGPESEAVHTILEFGVDHLKNMQPLTETHLLKTNPLYDEAAEYLQLLLDAKRGEAAELIDELVERGESVQNIYEHIFQATQYEIGVLWRRNEINISHEHYCTAATQLIMSRLYPIIFSSSKHGAKMVACSISNELHEIGIRMVSDFFEMDGWDTYYMGSNMPDKELIQSLLDYEADLLAISVTLPVHIGKVKSLIEKIRLRDDLKHLKIMAGGYPFSIIPDLQKKIGADATAVSAGQAVEKANALVR